MSYFIPAQGVIHGGAHILVLPGGSLLKFSATVLTGWTLKTKNENNYAK